MPRAKDRAGEVAVVNATEAASAFIDRLSFERSASRTVWGLDALEAGERGEAAGVDISEGGGASWRHNFEPALGGEVPITGE